MKHNRLIALLLSMCLLGTLFLGGCSINVNINANSDTQVTTSPLQKLKNLESQLNDLIEDDESSAAETQQPDSRAASSSPDKQETTTQPSAADKASYSIGDIKKLKNTQNFSKSALEHIFDGSINSKGNATGYHYNQIADSKGQIIKGTESKKDSHGVFTAKVKVLNVKKNGFSSFYPESWTPQQVVDAIDEAYRDALDDPANPHGSLWIGYSGDLEINMYLDNNKKITTAFPIYEGGN